MSTWATAQAAARWWRRSPVREAVLAVILAGTLLAGSYGEAHPSQISDKLPSGSAAAHTPDAALVLVAIACLVLAVRYRWPVVVLAVSTAAVTAYTAFGYVNGAALSVLTDREREVMSLVAGGLSNDEIAARLYLSPLTAKTHVSRIMTKLNARDRAQLVVLAYETGLVTPGHQPLP